MKYQGKLVLAPMVRVGTHPMRMLAAGYGADIVYSEELVDKRVMASVRRVNEALGTVDFLDKGGEQGGRVMFRTSPEERPRLVFQLGTADGVTALAAAQVVAGDVAAVDVNMGCPKQFSLQGGMGAALLRKPEVAEDILKTLRRNLQLPVSCKIRLLDDPRDTVELARRLTACGISALAVHGRTTQQRPRDPAAWEPIRQVVDALAGSVPVIANGDVMSYEDAQRVRQQTGCAAAMVARAAMWNASVFRPQGFLPLDEVQREYVRLALTGDNPLPNTKYCLKEMVDAPLSFPGRRGGPRSLVGHEGNTAVTRARDAGQLCDLLGLGRERPYQDLGGPAAGDDGVPGSGAGIRDGGAVPPPSRPGKQKQQSQKQQSQKQAQKGQSQKQAQKGQDRQEQKPRQQSAGGGARGKEQQRQQQQQQPSCTGTTAPQQPPAQQPGHCGSQEGERQPGQQPNQEQQGQEQQQQCAEVPPAADAVDKLPRQEPEEQQQHEGLQSPHQHAAGCNGDAPTSTAAAVDAVVTAAAAAGCDQCEGKGGEVLPLKRKREDEGEGDGEDGERGPGRCDTARAVR